LFNDDDRRVSFVVTSSNDLDVDVNSHS